MSDANVYLDNRYEYDFQVTKKDANTGKMIPAVGLTDLHGFISLAPDGASIHADLDVLLTERSGKPGNYYGVLPVSTINSRIFGVGGGTNLDGNALYPIAKNPDIHVYVKGVKAKATRQAA